MVLFQAAYEESKEDVEAPQPSKCTVTVTTDMTLTATEFFTETVEREGDTPDRLIIEGEKFHGRQGPHELDVKADATIQWNSWHRSRTERDRHRRFPHTASRFRVCPVRLPTFC